MSSLLIAVIYLAFISLGLPDSLLGSAWPVMHADIGASVSSAGIVTMIISAGTIVSALSTNKLVSVMGTPVVTAISVLLTAAAILAFSFASAFWQLCVFAVPYGLGAGAIDTSLNNFVAKHLSSRHMSWLHCCWGIGAMTGPYVMGYALTGAGGWHGGYRIIAAVQFVLTLVMFISVPRWRKAENGASVGEDEREEALSPLRTFRLKGAVFAFIAAMLYFAIEQLPIVWASTYFTEVWSLDADTAAFLASLFYIGITAGRGASGFVSGRAGDKLMIRTGIIAVLVGAALIAFAAFVGAFALSVIGFLLVGLGCAPVFPSLLHSVPGNFGKKYSGSVIGVTMAFSYTGMIFTPVLFGKLAELTTIELLPFGVMLLAAGVYFFTEMMNFKVKKNAL